VKIFVYERFESEQEAKSKTLPQKSGDLTCELVACL
jgi:hypothetical protein